MKSFLAALAGTLLLSSVALASGKCGTNVGRNTNTQTQKPATTSGDGAGVKR